ncbi:MAG: NUDIX hydrolase [Cellulomonas sp.]
MPSSRPSTGYDPAGFAPFAVAVDLVALTLRSQALHVLLVTRAEDPFTGSQALPGGFVRPGEDLVAAAARELAEETGLADATGLAEGTGLAEATGLGHTAEPHHTFGHLEQLATYGSPGRDPRMRVVSVAYLALAPRLPDPRPGGDVSAADWVPVDVALTTSLAFDHHTILTAGIERARSKLEYTSLATAFCPPEFTISDLRHVYEAVWGSKLDPRNFHRKVTSTPSFVIETGRTITDGPGRPAALYRSGPTTTLSPPLTREP